MEYKSLKFEIKNMGSDGTFEGYAAVKKNIDRANERIVDGAFKRTLNHNKTLPILFMHDPSEPIGVSTFMEEDRHGLFTRGKLDIEGNATARKVYSGMKFSPPYINSMSIGYKVNKDDYDNEGVRNLKEISLMEYSLVTRNFPANPEALVTHTKGFFNAREVIDLSRHVKELQESLSKINDRLDNMETKFMGDPQSALSHHTSVDPSNDTLLEEKAVTGNTDLPIAGRELEWDGGAAHKRIFAWAAKGDTFDPAKVKQAFFWFNGEDPLNKTAYKLPFADVINGKLTAIPRGIFAVAGALEGARGGVDISEADQSKIKGKVATYYNRMSKQFDDPLLKPPWEGKLDLVSLIREMKNYARSDR